MRHCAKFLLIGVCCTLLAGVGGCMVLGVIMDRAQDPVEPAKYVPAQENMLVVVEDYQNPALVEVIADHMNRQIGEELITHHVAPIVNPEKLSVLRGERGEAYRKMKVPALGTELGARQVLYADIKDFSLENAGGSAVVRAHAEAQVKLVDAATGETRWPREGTSSGYAVVVDIPFGGEVRELDVTQARQALGNALATRIARLFYNGAARRSEPAPAYPETDAR